MADNFKKPTPPRQQELSKRLQEPYQDSEGRFNRGNPNDFKYDNFNRGNQISYKNDNVKPFSLGIKDIDEAIFYYIKNVIKPTVMQNGISTDVPILYGDSEKWFQTQKKGFLRDQKGDILSPLILIKRNAINKERLTNKIDANNPHNFQVLTKTYNKNNAYDKFNLLNNFSPKKQFYATIIPDYVTLTYDVIINTYFVEQNNKIIEAMNYASDSYWGDPEKFKFRARIDTFANSTEIRNGAERIATTSFSLKLYGYIIPDTYIRDINGVKKFSEQTPNIFFTAENVVNESDLLFNPSLNVNNINPNTINDGEIGNTGIDINIES